MIGGIGECVNLRDVGESVFELSPDSAFLPPNRLFRGGRIDACSWVQLGAPKTVLNLRRDPDPSQEDLQWRQTTAVDFVQLTAKNDLEKYDTAQREVRQWLTSVAKLLSDESTRL